MPKIIKTTGVKATENIDEVVREYNALREQESIIKKRKDLLATTIKDYAKAHGSKSSTGSCYCENEDFTFGAMAKTSVSFNDKAVEFLKSRGFDKAIKVIEEPDEQEVEKLVSNALITTEELSAITSTKITYSVDVKEKQEVSDEVIESTIAASKKKSSGKSFKSKKRG